jgi:hypothetical protein
MDYNEIIMVIDDFINNNRIYVGASFIIASIVLFFLSLTGGNEAGSDGPAVNGRARSLSFNSSVMCESFPESAEVVQPWINILLLFHKCPDADTLAKIFQRTLKFERLSSILRYDANRQKYEFVYKEDVEISVESGMILNYSYDNETEMMAAVDEINVTNPLKDGPNKDTLPPWRIVRLVNKGNGVSCILLRYHHAIGDGIALINAMSPLFTYVFLCLLLSYHCRDYVYKHTDTSLTVFSCLLYTCPFSAPRSTAIPALARP